MTTNLRTALSAAAPDRALFLVHVGLFSVLGTLAVAVVDPSVPWWETALIYAVGALGMLLPFGPGSLLSATAGLWMGPQSKRGLAHALPLDDRKRVVKMSNKTWG